MTENPEKQGDPIVYKMARDIFPEGIYTYAFIGRQVLNLAAQKRDRRLRILDIGCGKGFFIAFLYRLFAAAEQDVDVYGFDVVEHAYRDQETYKKNLETLGEMMPDLDWGNRIKIISSGDNWPYEDEFFDIIVSNQVIEHVWDHTGFFAEHDRVMKQDGKGLHCFPSKHMLIECHVKAFRAHHAKDWYTARRRIDISNRLGMGDFSTHKLKKPDVDYNTFLDSRADYLLQRTNYLTLRELGGFLKARQLRHGLDLTADYFYGRLCRKVLRRHQFRMPACFHIFRPALTALFKYGGSVVCTVEKAGQSLDGQAMDQDRVKS